MKFSGKVVRGMNTFSTQLVKDLIKLSIIETNEVELYASATRDIPEQPVFRCRQSGVIFLEPIANKQVEHGDDLSYWGIENRDQFLAQSRDDDERRAAYLKAYDPQSRYLDIGCGLGGVLERTRNYFSTIKAVEPQTHARSVLHHLGYNVVADISEINGEQFDVVSLFHVFEHLYDPLSMLKSVKMLLAPDGYLIIEVPHANDALLSLYQCAPFKAFTLWSEHLVLHTVNSLTAMLKFSGFKVHNVQGVQRYNLANHQYWLSQGKPGGHIKWADKFSDKAITSYETSLVEKGLSDTLLIKASISG